MVIKEKLTPEVFLSAPRRGPAVPSPSGRIAFFTVSTHTFGNGGGSGSSSGTTKKEVMLIDLGSGSQWQVSQDDKIHDVNWIPGDTSDSLVWLRDADKGETELTVVPATGPDQTPEPYVAGTIPGKVEALKLKKLEDQSIACAVVGLAEKDGSLYNEETAEKPASTARIYDSLHIREWDTYIRPQKHSIFYSRLTTTTTTTTAAASTTTTTAAAASTTTTSKYTLASPLRNILRESTLEAPAEVYEPGDATDNYDVGPKGIVFVARDPHPDKPVKFGCSDVYFVALDSFARAAAYKPSRILLQGDRFSGSCSNPRFSPDGTMVAFLKSPLRSPADARLLMGHIGSGAAFDVFRLVIAEPWARVPSSFEYAPAGDALFVVAEDCGRDSLFALALGHKARPRPLALKGSVVAHYPIPEGKEEGGRGGGGGGKLLVTGSSLVDSCFYQVVDLDYDNDDDNNDAAAAAAAAAAATFEPRLVLTSSKDGTRYGLNYKKQVSEVYFEGSGDYCVQAWIVRPSDFDESKKYPVAVLVHGGPASSWKDQWHMRWNAMVWAEQGYVTVLPNITGSTGFGVDHAARIYGSWGGFPYEDLVNCMEYLKNIPYIDIDRAVAAGGSYGGYMMNWINGNPLGRKFKAVVCHDSVFSTESMTLMTDESDGIAEWKGPAFAWSNHELLNKWNPARPDLLANWRRASPTLVIHSDKDYRCPITDGIAVFKTLQFLGVPSRFLNFPDENHFVSKPENSREWHRVVFDWINRYSGVEAKRAAREETTVVVPDRAEGETNVAPEEPMTTTLVAEAEPTLQ